MCIKEDKQPAPEIIFALDGLPIATVAGVNRHTLWKWKEREKGKSREGLYIEVVKRTIKFKIKDLI